MNWQFWQWFRDKPIDPVAEYMKELDSSTALANQLREQTGLNSGSMGGFSWNTISSGTIDASKITANSISANQISIPPQPKGN